MLEPDIPVWWRFFDLWKHEIKRLWYDCLLGGPFLTEEEEKDPIKKSWRYVNSKRPDAIAELENEVWIIEVSANPGLRALGQIVAYQTLWQEDPKIEKIDKAVLVVETLDTDLGAAAAKLGALIFVV